MSNWTYFGEHAEDSKYRRAQLSRELCLVLSGCYPTVRFNRVDIVPRPDQQFMAIPQRDIICIRFNLSGSAEALLQHGFAHPAWIACLPPSGVKYQIATRGFGSAWQFRRTRTGYRVSGGAYADGLDRLTRLLMPGLLAGVAGRGDLSRAPH